MDLSQMPNPLYPLAWLPPDIAKQVENTRYILVGCMAAWVWDVLVSIPEERRMIRKTGLRLPDAIYFVSRLAEASFLISTLIYGVGSVKNCHAVGLAQGWTAAFQYIFNALLFVFRIRAVFYHQRYVVWFFYFMWVAVVATCLVAPFGLDAVALPPTGLCVDTRLSHSSAGGIIVAAINDTMIFTFITAKLVLQAHGAENLRSFFKILFSGKGMGHVSRVVLQTGQLYYLATAGITVACAVAILTPTVPTPYTDVMVVVNGFMTNVMTTRVYRLLKLGLIYDHNTYPSVQVSTVELRVRSPLSGSANTTQTHPLGSHMGKSIDSAMTRAPGSIPYTGGSESAITPTDEWKSGELYIASGKRDGDRVV
ncbi:hypothetical protein EIP91_010065 [Steccherinum ochraceum]|uniref:Transmembrane protein n=1 Tax=Steccherinum ochraceum TaxID=92696 RepID=A0A4R0RD90_9APHY|nr:hypothetical protein EIP91_010065 [Steccherinum ochraceum]